MAEVLMPRLSDTMTEGVLVQWLKSEGDEITRGDVIAEVETDKATMEVEAYETGVLTSIIAAPGSTVPIGQPIAVIGDDAAASASAPAPVAPAVTATAEPAAAEPAAAEPAAAEPAAAEPPPVAQQRPATPAPEGGKAGAPIPMSPLARSLAHKHGVDLNSVVGTGPGGRIVRADVEAAVAAQTPAAATATAAGSTAVTAAPDDERVPLTAIRRITAQRLSESAAAPHFYLTSIVQADALLALRAEVNGALADTGAKVSVTDMLIRACALALRAHPHVNASWGGDHLLQHGHINVGIAVALDDGLIVPVIRDADRKSLSEIATEARALAERARAGKLAPDEFRGGTFTISNLGMFGIDNFTAVINPPEAAILAVGAAREEAVVRDGQLVIASTMKLTLTIDHRVLDGATAAAFLRDLVDLLDHPLRIVV